DTAVMRALKKIRVPAKQRNRELGLLLFAIAVYGGAIVLVQLGVNNTVEAGYLSVAAIPAVLALIMHVVLRLRARDADPFVLPIATVLTGLGIAMIYRIDLADKASGWDAT
ncbi:cell division protein FtsW, partial [Xanthomonas perforans]